VRSALSNDSLLIGKVFSAQVICYFLGGLVHILQGRLQGLYPFLQSADNIVEFDNVE
jgi:hypothetical protein